MVRISAHLRGHPWISQIREPEVQGWVPAAFIRLKTPHAPNADNIGCGLSQGRSRFVRLTLYSVFGGLGKPSSSYAHREKTFHTKSCGPRTKGSDDSLHRATALYPLMATSGQHTEDLAVRHVCLPSRYVLYVPCVDSTDVGAAILEDLINRNSVDTRALHRMRTLPDCPRPVSRASPEDWRT